MATLRIPTPSSNIPPSKAQGLVDRIAAAFRELPDSRKPGNNTKSSMHDAACSAFSVFFTQCPSFLAFQRNLALTTGRNNVQSLFGVHDVPTDVQIRNILDSVEAKEMAPLIQGVGDTLWAEGCLSDYQVLNGSVLIALDGTDTFSSDSGIHCPSCHVTHRSDGSVQHRHIAVTPALVAPGEPRVVPLPPEFVVPQDGHAKQDCEIRAASRWIDAWGAHYAPWGVTLLGDDLYAHQPFCEKVKAAGFHFLFTCKPASHPTLTEWVDDFTRSGQIGTHSVILARSQGKPKGKRIPKVVRERWSFRFMADLPLRDADDALLANWFELTVTDEETGKVLYLNSWITDHPITFDTLVDLAKAGRARWKIENEHIQTLKIGGYRLEQNFGHGKRHLSNLLASMNILAFLVHTAFEFLDTRYRTLRFRYGSRVAFFQRFATLLEWALFENWDHVIAVMFAKLRVDTG
jgi:hypothetical protein